MSEARTFGTEEVQTIRKFRITAREVQNFMQFRFDEVARAIESEQKARWEANGRRGDMPRARYYPIGCFPKKQEAVGRDGTVYTPFYLIMPIEMNRTGRDGGRVASVYTSDTSDNVMIVREYWNMLMPLTYDSNYKNMLRNPGGNRLKFWADHGLNNERQVNSMLAMSKLHIVKDEKKRDDIRCIGLLLNPYAVLKVMVMKAIAVKHPELKTQPFDIEIELDMRKAVRPSDYVYDVKYVPSNGRASHDNADSNICMQMALEICNGIASDNRPSGPRYGK